MYRELNTRLHIWTLPKTYRRVLDHAEMVDEIIDVMVIRLGAPCQLENLGAAHVALKSGLARMDPNGSSAPT